eukprot:TRINITY_DN18630_c0_g1_i1.p1 TRINITY_DN18630_c0_g1~~TRINITY_DN18630_c0_g1_i1.p1  ORF type:complete len:622 (-),score=127.54 TRINITY_DN18630_c0_g1_i1:931-2796(-)
MEGCEGMGFVTHDQQVIVKDDFTQSHATGGVIVENKEVISLQLNQQNIISHIIGNNVEAVIPQHSLAELMPVKRYSDLTTILRTRLHGVDFYGDDTNVLGIFNLEGDGATMNSDSRLCVNLGVVGDKISLKTLVSKFEVLDASSSDLSGIVEEINGLKTTKFCQGMKEELILPNLASFESTKLMTALFLIEKLSTGFVYKSRQCKSVVDITGNVCKACKEFFDNLLFVNSKFNNDLEDVSDIHESEDKFSEPVQACFDDSSDDDFGGKNMSSNIVGSPSIKKNLKSYDCDLCDTKFKFRKSYIKHVESVHETFITTDETKSETKKEKKYFCEDGSCEKSFTSLVRLNKHLSKTHNINTPSTEATAKTVQNVKCPFCQDEFKVPEGKVGNHRLRMHLKSVHSKLEGEESWQQIIKEEASESVICQACGKSYTNQATLESHVKLMHSDNTEMESCHICGKSFKKGGSTLWGHIRTHEDGGHICAICGAKFKVKSYLQRHIKSHDPDCKRYECDICGDKFTRPYLMKQHQEFTHKKNLPFKCNECGKSLRSNTFLKIHMRSVHSKEKPFPCEICGFRSSRVDNLNIHRTKVHHITVKITRSQLQQLVLEGKHPFCTNPDDIPAF